MVLIVLVLVLMYRVYGIISVPEAPAWPAIPIPLTELPDDRTDQESLGLPSRPPMVPTDGVPGTYTSLYERNPFWYYGSTTDSRDSQQIRPEDLNITLLKIQDVSGRPRAQLRTASTTKWYSEGEQFEEFELISIDAEEESVVIYSERYARQFTLKK
ncbi:MAG: hypothetical protein ACOYI9_04485 [Candidatus Hydrogenedentales bacterium]